jgi:hypothetical protein
MKQTGYEWISEHDCMDLHYKYAEEKKKWKFVEEKV